MPLKVKLKSYLFHALEILPRELGDRFYHSIQNIVSTKDLSSKIDLSFNTFQSLKNFTEKNGIEIRDKQIVEIGSGWLPLMPYFLKYMGKASRIKSYDLYRHYQKNKIRKLNQIFSQKFGISIRVKDGTDYELPKGIDYFPFTDITSQSVAGAGIIFSRFVLEHVEPEMIEKMHCRFKKDLKPGSHIIHMISPSDHRAYNENALSLQDFLRYSKTEWDNMQTRFDYHNRLRLPQYLNIFKSQGFEVVDLTYDLPKKDSENYRKFKKLNLHEDFKGYTEEELMAGSINIVLKT